MFFPRSATAAATVRAAVQTPKMSPLCAEWYVKDAQKLARRQELESLAPSTLKAVFPIPGSVGAARDGGVKTAVEVRKLVGHASVSLSVSNCWP